MDALKQLRPRFSSLCRQAGLHKQIFTGGAGPKLKLESINHNVIIGEQLDSDLLLGCFEVDPVV